MAEEGVKPPDQEKSRANRTRYLEDFDDVLKEEHAAINRRRKIVGGKTYEEQQDKPVGNPENVKPLSREEITRSGGGSGEPPGGDPAAGPAGTPPRGGGTAPKPIYETVGLALSGGGIRSASFCLGTLQALDQNLALGRVDYLSTVSGGGYIGASTVATMLDSPEFVYSPAGNIAGQRPNAGNRGDRSDTVAVSHLRNHSRYLIPTGFQSLFQNIAILLRGWAASAFLVVGIMITAAFITLMVDPSTNQLNNSAISTFIDRTSSLLGKELAFTKILLSLVATYLVIWAILRSILESPLLASPNQPDVRSPLTRVAQWLLVILALFFLVEMQPVAVRAMRSLVDNNAKAGPNLLYSGLLYLALGIALTIAFASRFLAERVKQESTQNSWMSLLRGTGAQFVLLTGACLLPLIIYVGYVWLAAVGVCESKNPCQNATAYALAPWWLTGWIKVGLPFKISDLFTSEAATQAAVTPVRTWAMWLARFDQPILQLYGIVAVPMLVISYLLTPNANSLHSLYRDRLAKAFLFDPKSLSKPDIRSRKRDPDPLSSLKLSKLRTGQGPFPIINTALNIQGSSYLNRRGRNAEFFTFTPLRVGSEATGFAATEMFEKKLEKGFDLATAMAISGAAISSNMGKQTLRSFTLTLALLNLRLGYWLRNPRQLKPGWKGTLRSRLKSALYLLAEGLGRLDEKGDGVYLTDGGHIENLGLYSLLRRRCELIIVIDSECDQGYAFESLIAAQRYARIDLGIRIFLPWEVVRDDARRVSTLTTGKILPADFSDFGKHVAIGMIEYDVGVFGWLLYVKASLSGDEGDGILDYKRRHPVFPQETTGDQFFSEEQFEVYRSLGFHIMNGFLEKEPIYAALPPAMVAKLGASPGADPQREVLRRLGL